jgi:hypothetical protein
LFGVAIALFPKRSNREFIPLNPWLAWRTGAAANQYSGLGITGALNFIKRAAPFALTVPLLA